jgi:small subunit ribosomal protein S9
VADAKKKNHYLGTGRRKKSVARVRLSEGTGKILINDRPLDNYFTEIKDRNAVTGPLDATDMRTRVDIHANVDGGGITGQSGALCQGVARALKHMFGLTTEPEPAPSADGQASAEGATAPPSMSKKLRDSGYLTRDGRMKERKKYGRKGARKAFQFSKR